MQDAELIRELRRKADEYQQRADACRQAAKTLETGTLLADVEPPAPSEGTGASNRLLEIADFLRRNGPATRGEVMEHSGVPAGTVRALLNRTHFERDDETGRWVRLRQDSDS